MRERSLLGLPGSVAADAAVSSNMEILLIVLVVLGLVTLIGHLIWLVLAALIRASLGREQAEPDQPVKVKGREEKCAQCGRILLPWQECCRVCGLDRQSATAQELKDLEATARQLATFRDAATLDAATFQSLLDAVTARRRELIELRSPLVPKPVAAPAAGREKSFTRAPEKGPARPAPIVPAEEEVLEVLPVSPTMGPQAAPARNSLRAARPAPRPAPPPPPPQPKPPKPPRRSLAELLAAFMEERNIFWGELVGGLLMVGCSIALVIYLWKDLQRIPYFQFLIFVSTTAALFGAGLYALHRLKLQTTGRGLLVIATLLVPLNFLVMAGLADQEGPADLFRTSFRIGTEAASLALFGVLMGSAARSLVPDGRWPLLLAVLGASASQLAVPRFLEHGQTALWPFLSLSLLPLASYGASAASLLNHLSRQRLDDRQANGLFAFLGMSIFPLVIVFGFLAYWTGDLGWSLEHLALPVAVAGIPVLLGGTLVQRRIAQDAQPGVAVPRQGAIQTVGTAVELAGMLVMLSAVILAWPQPVAIILVCALDFAVLTAVALVYRLPAAHGPALASLAVGYLTACHLLMGHLAVARAELARQLLALTISAQSGGALVLLVALLGAVAALFIRTGRRSDAVLYAAGGAIAACVSLVLVNLRGYEFPALATIVTGIYALASLALNLRLRRPSISYLGLSLVLVATLWGLWWANEAVTPLWGTMLAIESLAMAVVAVSASGARRGQSAGLNGASRLSVFFARSLTRAAWRDVAAAVGIIALGLASWSAIEAPWARPHTWTSGVLAATALLLACAYRATAFTWVGSALILGSILHGTATGLHLRHPALFALLSHATALVICGILFRMRKVDSPPPETSSVAWRRILVGPLWQSALVSSLLALPMMSAEAWGEMGPLTVFMAWLSAIWLVMAWTECRPLLFTGFQATLTATIVLGVAASLQNRMWGDWFSSDLADPKDLYAYGLGLGALSLLWTVMRLVLREQQLAQRLLEPPWPAVDRVVLGTLVLGQMVLALAGVVTGTLLELSPGGGSLVADLLGSFADIRIYHPGAWPLLAILSLALGLGLRGRRPADALLGLVIVAVTVPILLAVDSQIATASALRWGLSSCFLVCSLLLAGYGDRSAVRPARRLLVGFCVVPVLLLTSVAALGILIGHTPPRLVPGSIFGGMSTSASYLLPLILISLGLVVHALRERSAGYAFAAGLVINLAVMGGYALTVVSGGQVLGEAEWVRLFQLGTIAAALWALGWLVCRPWVVAWREGPHSRLAAELMTAQLGMCAAGNAFLLLVGLWLLVSFFPALGPWTAEVGSPLGWSALVLATIAAAWRARQRNTGLQPHTVGSLGMAGVGLLACTVAGHWPKWGYRALMVGWASYAPALVAAAWVREWQRGRVTEQAGDDADTWQRLRVLVLALSRALTPAIAAFWVHVVGVLVIALGLRAAIVHHDHLWAASAIAMASSAGAAMAVWRRREAWAFTFGLGVNLAASLVVWHIRLQDPFADWWIYLLQANVIAASAVALLWLGVRKRLYGTEELSLTRGPLLATQVVLGLCGNAVLLLGPLGWLFAQPGKAFPADLLLVGQIPGWLALFLTVAAALWYADQIAPAARGHVLGAFGLAVGVLAACSASRWANPGDWLAYHVLTAAWTGTGLIILMAEPIAKLRGGEFEEFSSLPWIAQLLRFSSPQFRRWLDAVGLLVLALTVRGLGSDPSRPYWSAGATLAVSAMAGAVAVRSQLPAYVYLSGLLVNLAGSMIWLAWGPSSALSFGYAQVICFALTSGGWSVTELALEARRPPLNLRGSFVPFTHLAISLGLCLLSLLVAICIASDVVEGELEAVGALPWTALVAMLAALLIHLGDGTARYTLGGLYTVGLAAIGLTLHTVNLDPRALGWYAGLALAAYVLLTGLIGWTAARLRDLRGDPGPPDRDSTWAVAWFPVAQTAVGLVIVGLSLWMSLTFDKPPERLAGPLSVALLLAAGVLLAHTVSGRWANDLRYAALVLGLITVVEGSWALLQFDQPPLWLYRSILVMAALALTTWLYGAGLPRVLRQLNEWATCGRRIGPVLGALASVMLLVVLVQEGLLYDRATSRTPMHPLAIAAVVVAIVGMIAAGIYFALVPGRGPLGLSDRGRKLYVYAGEVLVVLLLVHTRLTMPELFGGRLVQYWTLIVMAVAYVGVGLGEFFRRRGLLVLAEPLERTGLFLPMFPLLTFWVHPPAFLYEFADDHDGKYALLWFLLGLLYAFVAVTKRSSRFALAAALAGNFSLWAWLFHQDLGFLVHPQMWLIPVALIALVAEHLNRDRLTEPQGNALRYLALIAIYVSSTADMFIAGLGESVLWPLVLAMLSIAGVLAGILLRVRSFLYLGVTFLFVVIFTMIWHAAVGQHQIWVWWASGIALGAAIIVLFAVFEKRHNDVLRVLEQLKKWD